MLPNVDIIILNWNGLEDTITCLESLKKVDYPNFNIIVVDNGSTDGSQLTLKNYSGIKFIENGINLGFAEGNNVGIRYALSQGTDYVLLLNNDTTVDSQFLSCLVKASESNSEIGIAGPKIYYGKSKKIWFAGGRIDLSKGDTYHTGKNEIDKGQYEMEVETDFVTGCALLIKSEVLRKIGLLDPRYFVYFEDSDLCMRARRAGYKCVYAPKSIVWHEKVKGTNPLYDYSHLAYYYIRNQIIFTRMYGTKISWAYLIKRMLFIFVSYSIKRNIRLMKLALRAYYDAFIRS